MFRKMTGHVCIVGGNSKAKDPSVTFHRIPKDVERRALWLVVFDISVDVVKESTKVCCCFLNDNETFTPLQRSH